jgi:hypothetical protein
MSAMSCDDFDGGQITYDSLGKVVQNKPIPLKHEEEWHKRWFAALKEEKALYDEAAKKGLGELAAVEFVAKHTLTAMTNSEDKYVPWHPLRFSAHARAWLAGSCLQCFHPCVQASQGVEQQALARVRCQQRGQTGVRC